MPAAPNQLELARLRQRRYAQSDKGRKQRQVMAARRFYRRHGVEPTEAKVQRWLQCYRDHKEARARIFEMYAEACRDGEIRDAEKRSFAAPRELPPLPKFQYPT